MSNIRTVFKRELASYFATPVAYVFIVIFLLLAGAFTFYLGNFYERGQADLLPFFNFHPWLYLFLVPAVGMRLWSEEQIRRWTNLRVRAGRQANRPLGPESSIGKVVQGALNQAIQVAAVDLLGPAATAWPTDAPATDALAYGESLPYEVHGMLRSRANTIEGGTTEVNKNILAERVLGLPREPDPWHGRPWSEIPR